MLKVFAEGITNPVLPAVIGQGGNAQGGKAVGLLISNLVGFFFILGFFLSFFIMLSGAIGWITSGGDKNNLENSRNRIIHSLIGFIILAAAWAIFTLIGQFIGFNDIKSLPIPTIK